MLWTQWIDETENRVDLTNETVKFEAFIILNFVEENLLNILENF